MKKVEELQLKKQKKEQDKKYINRAIIIIYIVLGISIPVILKFFVFENNVYSNLSNDGWASFLGSYVGGVLGGLGTLIAMYMTIKQTMEIQAENKKDTNQRIIAENHRHNQEYTQQFIDRHNEREADMANRLWEIRKEFADSIAELIGRYITQISKYDFASINAE